MQQPQHISWCSPNWQLEEPFFTLLLFALYTSRGDPSCRRCLKGPLLQVTRKSVCDRNCSLGHPGKQRGPHRKRCEDSGISSPGLFLTAWNVSNEPPLFPGNQILSVDGEPAEQAGCAQQQPLALHPDWQRHLREVRFRGQAPPTPGEAHLPAEDQHPYVRQPACSTRSILCAVRVWTSAGQRTLWPVGFPLSSYAWSSDKAGTAKGCSAVTTDFVPSHPHAATVVLFTLERLKYAGCVFQVWVRGFLWCVW